MNKLFKELNIWRCFMAVLMALLLCVTILPVFANAQTGKVGGIKWSVDGGLLTIEGKGQMPDFTEHNPAPWAEYATTVTHLSIDSRITSIGALAFYGFESLATIDLPKNVKNIGYMAFANCKNAKNLTLLQVETIGEQAFTHCLELQTVVLPQTLTTIGGGAFYRCESLCTISIPKSVTQMGDSVFAYCKELLSVNVYANITALPEWTFYGCKNLNTLYLSATVTTIGNKAFEGCDVLTYLNHEGNAEQTEQLKQGLEATQDGFYEVNINGEVQTPPVESTNTVVTKEDDEYVRTDSVVENTPNAVIKTETSVYHTATEDGYSEKKNNAKIKINATIATKDGWNELYTRLETEYANRGALEGETKTDVDIDVDVTLLDGSYIYRETLQKIAGRRVALKVCTPNGSRWEIHGKKIAGYSFKAKYNLEYNYSLYEKFSKSHSATLGGSTAYKLQTTDKIDFPITLMAYIDGSLTNSNATLFDDAFGGKLKQIKTVAINDGIAAFRVSNINKGQRYVIGVNVVGVSPDQIEQRPVTDDNRFENYVPVTEQYEITEVRGFMGMTMKQFTTVVIIAIVSVAFVVFVIMLVLNMMAKKKAMDNIRNKNAE